MKSEGRNPKGEGSPKSEVRSPKRGRAAVCFLLSVFCFLSSAFGSATVSFPICQFTSGAATNRTVLITPLQLTPATNQVASYDRLTYDTGAGGTFTVTNMMAGLYRVSIQAPPDTTSFAILVPASGAVSADTLLVATPQTVTRPQDYAYSATASDTRYAKVGDGGLAFSPQFGSANLTNWAQLATNVLGSAGSGAAGVASLNSITGAVALVEGSNITLTTNAGAGTITISSAASGELATNAINATNFWGTLSPTNLPAGLATSNFVGTFAGNGAGVTNLAAGDALYDSDAVEWISAVGIKGNYALGRVSGFYAALKQAGLWTGMDGILLSTNFNAGTLRSISGGAAVNYGNVGLDGAGAHYDGTNGYTVLPVTCASNFTMVFIYCGDPEPIDGSTPFGLFNATGTNAGGCYIKTRIETWGSPPSQETRMMLLASCGGVGETVTSGGVVDAGTTWGIPQTINGTYVSGYDPRVNVWAIAWTNTGYVTERYNNYMALQSTNALSVRFTDAALNRLVLGARLNASGVAEGFCRVNLQAAFLWPGVLTSNQVWQVSKAAQWLMPGDERVLFVGDSMTAFNGKMANSGNGLTNWWPGILLGVDGIGREVGQPPYTQSTPIDIAKNGIMAGTYWTYVPWLAGPYSVGGPIKRVTAHVLIGINDIGNGGAPTGGATGAQTFLQVSNVWKALRDNIGARIVAYTLPNTSSNAMVRGIQYWLNHQAILDCNALIRSAHGQYDDLVDLGMVFSTNMMLTSNIPLYSRDGLHMAGAGASNQAAQVKAAFRVGYYSGAFTGDGSGLTNLPTGSGSGDAVKGADQTWTGVNGFSNDTRMASLTVSNSLVATNVALYGAVNLNSLTGGNMLQVDGDSPGMLTGYGQWNLASVYATNFTGNGSGLTNLNAASTNKVISGATFAGNSTNQPGATHTGGRLETNWTTGNWAQTTNGAITLGTNGGATITLNGVNGTIIETTNIVSKLLVGGATNNTADAVNITGSFKSSGTVSASAYAVGSYGFDNNGISHGATARGLITEQDGPQGSSDWVISSGTSGSAGAYSNACLRVKLDGALSFVATNGWDGTLTVPTNVPTLMAIQGYSVVARFGSNITSAGAITATNGVVSYGSGWAGTTNAMAPSDTATIKGWVNYTNTGAGGGVFKMPLYQ